MMNYTKKKGEQKFKKKNKFISQHDKKQINKERKGRSLN